MAHFEPAGCVNVRNRYLKQYIFSNVNHHLTKHGFWIYTWLSKHSSVGAPVLVRCIFFLFFHQYCIYCSTPSITSSLLVKCYWVTKMLALRHLWEYHDGTNHMVMNACSILDVSTLADVAIAVVVEQQHINEKLLEELWV